MTLPLAAKGYSRSFWRTIDNINRMFRTEHQYVTMPKSDNPDGIRLGGMPSFLGWIIFFDRVTACPAETDHANLEEYQQGLRR
jgi:hypothetical protein